MSLKPAWTTYQDPVSIKKKVDEVSGFSTYQAQAAALEKHM
jgi:hypothetical protein